MIEFILSLISIPKILELPLIVQGPGLLILAYLVYRLVRSITSLKPIRAITSVIMFVVVAIILSRFGDAIVVLIEGSPSQ